MNDDNQSNATHPAVSDSLSRESRNLLDVGEEVPLQQFKDEWRPEDKKTEELYETTRTLLNELMTPEKFASCVEKLKNLDLDTKERLTGVVNLIFEKVVYGSSDFCKQCAKLCSVMENFIYPSDLAREPSFRGILLTKCQQGFESLMMNNKEDLAEIDVCGDPKRKKELQLLFEEKEWKAQQRDIGVCRFIGELFNLRMLTPNIMMRCSRTLIANPNEKSLECLCVLLTTIGKALDEKVRKELDTFFKKLQDVADAEKTEGSRLSSLIRSQILDVINLRKNRWYTE